MNEMTIAGEVLVKPDWQGREDCRLGMDNLDYEIDEGFEEALRAGKRGSHAALHFYGHVWYADGEFHEDVWRHHSSVDTVSAATLRDLLEKVNTRYGWE